MVAHSLCLLFAMLDSHVPYVDTLYIENDYNHAVLVVRKRDTVSLFIDLKNEQGPVDYIVCKSKLKSGPRTHRTQIEDTSNGVLIKGFKINLSESISKAITSGSLDFSPAHVKINDGCVVFYGRWITQYGDFREGKTAFVIHQIKSGQRTVLKWEDVLDKQTLEKLSQKNLYIDEVVNYVSFENNVLAIDLNKIDGLVEKTRIQKTLNLAK